MSGMLLAWLLLLGAGGGHGAVPVTTLPRGSAGCTGKGGKMTVVTFVYPPEGEGYTNFLLTARTHGWHVVNVGRPWERRNWTERTEAYLTYLTSLPAETQVVLSDGSDVLFTGPPPPAEDFPDHVVFSAERLCDTDSCRAHPELVRGMADIAKGPMKFLNFGLAYGRARKLAEVLRNMSFAGGRDDQAAAAELMINHPDLISLDYGTQFFAVISPSEQHFRMDWEITECGEAIRRKVSLARPFALHFAGMTPHDNFATPCQRFQLELYRSLLPTGTSRTHRVVISMTTTPLRLPHILPTLNSLLAQDKVPDAIYLNIPWRSKRFNREYVVPAAVKAYAAVTIVRTEDFGPITKLLPTLQREQDPNTLIVTVDDEYWYPPQMLSTLVEQYKVAPFAAYAFAGQMVQGGELRSGEVPSYRVHPTGVDVLEGFLGALYRRGDLQGIRQPPPDCWTADDVWISAHLKAKGIPRVMIPMPFPRPVDGPLDREAPLRGGNFAGGNACCIRLFTWERPESVQEAALCPVRPRAIPIPQTMGHIAPWWSPVMITSPCNLAHPSGFRRYGNCSNGIQDGNETGIDCGGSCPPCGNCTNGIQDGNETGIDCGGNCTPC
eukprot:Sspe_Gene.37565::Locus_18130_Transcript_1_1_Confidence_1.000_Length_1867::g.37565::m.37565